MISIPTRFCGRHPEVRMTFDKAKNQWFCEKCDDSVGSIEREIVLPTGSILTTATSSTSGVTALELLEQAEELAEEVVRLRTEELNFLEFIKNRGKKDKETMALRTLQGDYWGPVIYADTTHVVQKSSRTEFMIHAQFDPPLTQGDEVIEIKYKNGLGVVVPVKHVDKSQGR